MPPSRSADAPQRPARVSQLKTTSSDSVRSFRRPIADGTPKLADRRSPRESQSTPVTEKKLGTRIAGLESQLGQAQEELKILKKQLASADAAKHGSHDKTEKSKKKKPIVLMIKDECKHLGEVQPSQSPTKTSLILTSVLNESSPEMDVFEVPLEKDAFPELTETEKPTLLDDHEVRTKSMNNPENIPPNLENEKALGEELAMKTEEISTLKSKLEDSDKVLQAYTESNNDLQKQLSEATTRVSLARVKEEELDTKLSHLSKELELSKENTTKIYKKLEATDGMKQLLETEIKKLRVQTEQWRKAADAASAVLAGENGRSMSFNNLFEAPVALYDEFGSPGFADDMNAGSKKKGSGIKMLGDLWKKKGHK